MKHIDCLIVIFTALTTISTTGLFIYAIVQSKLIYRSIDESVKSRSAVVLLEVYKYLNELSPKWHKVNTFDNNCSKWSKKEISIAYDVALEFQRISYLVQKQLLPPEYIIEGYGPVIIGCWNKLEKYIKNYRKQCGEPPELSDGGYQRMHFELLANECKKKFQK